MSKFVTITREEFENLMKQFSYHPVDLKYSNEYVFDIETDRPEISVRIYSTVDKRTDKTRDIGTDAIRVVYWDNTNDRPLGKGKKILRVEGKTTVSERIASRVNEFMMSIDNINIIDFEYVRAVLSSPAVNWMDFAQSLLDNLDTYGSLSDNQLAYVLGDTNPRGKMTIEKRVKENDPDFLERYISSNGDSDEDDYENNPGTDEEVVHNEKDESKENESDREQPEIPRNEKISEDEPEKTEMVDNQEGDRNISLQLTSDYKPYKYPFDEFNPVQTMTFPHITKDENLVIGANTSAGKTICAELIMDHVLSQGQKIIYLSPLKALTQEKYEDWQKRYSDKEIIILTGDYRLSKKRMDQLAEAEIIVMTSEMLDSRTRKMKSEKNLWLKDVGLVIVDESHILSTDRGHPVECGIMRFTKINPRARVLFLSATMPNVGELAEWLSVLNNKPSGVIFSKWRPVFLNMNFCEYRIACYHNGRQDYWRTQENKISLAVETIMSKPDEKFLCFVHDKNTGRKIIQRLSEIGEDSVFHNADLNLKERLEIESSFSNRTNGLRVLISTSTIAWGRNLPARNVVIVGVHRGIQEVDQLDIIQMAGRAGRYGIDDEGHVFLVIPEGSSLIWKDVFVNPRPVLSVLNKPATLAFHTLAEVMNNEIEDPITMLEWFKRSLSYKQNNRFTSEDAQFLINTLHEIEMLTNKYGKTRLTNLGKVSALLYFSPYDVYAWYENFDKLFNEGIEINDKTLAWAIGSIPSNDWGYIPKDLESECQIFKWDLLELGIKRVQALPSVVAIHSALTGDDDITGSLKAIKRNLMFDTERQVEAIKFIDELYTKWNKKHLWKVLPMRIKYGVPAEMIHLVRIPRVGRVRATRLWNAGFRSFEKIADPANKRELAKMFTPAFIKQLQKDTKKLIEKEVN